MLDVDVNNESVKKIFGMCRTCLLRRRAQLRPRHHPPAERARLRAAMASRRPSPSSRSSSACSRRISSSAGPRRMVGPPACRSTGRRRRSADCDRRRLAPLLQHALPARCRRRAHRQQRAELRAEAAEAVYFFCFLLIVGTPHALSLMQRTSGCPTGAASPSSARSELRRSSARVNQRRVYYQSGAFAASSSSAATSVRSCSRATSSGVIPTESRASSGAPARDEEARRLDVARLGGDVQRRVFREVAVAHVGLRVDQHAHGIGVLRRRLAERRLHPTVLRVDQ